jgi:uncharacterized integral membrane protein (TIGR00698 family)
MSEKALKPTVEAPQPFARGPAPATGEFVMQPDPTAEGPHTPTRTIPFFRRQLTSIPGIFLTAVLALLAFEIRRIPGLAIASPMIMATFLGMALHNSMGTPTWAKAGVRFALRRILRLGIILLGLQLMISQVTQVGAAGCIILAITVLTTLVATKWLARAMGVDRKLGELIAVGTSICGASAIIAANTVTQGSDEDVAYAIACVTVFGSLAIFLYPMLPGLLQLSPKAFGLWSGASIHEIAQVVAAAFQDGAQAGDTGTVVKLTRVMMLAPLVIALGVAAADRVAPTVARPAPPMPWFVLGFVALMLINSFVKMPQSVMHVIVPFTTFLLSMALAAMGLETDFRKLKAKGWVPLGLAAIAWIFIALISFTLIKLFGYR